MYIPSPQTDVSGHTSASEMKTSETIIDINGNKFEDILLLSSFIFE